ncbi:ATP-binding protein [Desulforhopalus singaporensis]|uniref:MinD superfamily P-loop ATPase, contains an inserted ferredoxin domain n=1 Tax=Desulforhopalus singaporensis TaxID=91360 RepID=A0A1H0M0C3_9BACT|nr:ATP-binding protein [Desulforhopalus singaporensis]SDO73919.1 MinD superfamily P-loop ATPase, contains an inserted ferredoxin domain [Desulforhopalus singaporensis]
MRELVILSGKGGTGKTSITGAFASLAPECMFCDADVDAADLHLLLNPRVEQSSPFMGGSLAIIRPEMCCECGRCRELCRFDAISESYEIDRFACEGCGVCVDLCPEQAIEFPVQQCGEWFVSDTRFGPMVHARLGIAEENSGKLVSLVRRQARQLAIEKGCNLILTDGPPGIGCSVIASLGGATAVVIIVEPTVSGLHDMERVADLAAHFKVPGMVCINKYDLNEAMTVKIERYARSRNMQILGRVPFDSLFVAAMIEGKNIFEHSPESEAAGALRSVWCNIMDSQVMNSLGIRDLKQVIQ